MPRSRWLACAVFALVALTGCTKGDECDRCSDDADCAEGFVCSTFSDGSRRCGSGEGATQCRVR